MIVIEDLQKSFGKDTLFQNVSLQMEKGETVSILGHSGSGKTSLLKILAGLLPMDGGSFRMDGTDLFKLPAQRRGVIYLSQEPLLFPHLNVAGNLAFGLKIRKWSPDDIVEKVAHMAEALGLTAHLKKSVDQLSGGQRQRVSFGRALITDPKMMLLDEPFGSLDAHTRTNMQQLFKKVSKELQMTALFVTHDLKEALEMGDRIGLLKDERLQLFDSPEAFAQARNSPVQKEIAYWNNLLSNG